MTSLLLEEKRSHFSHINIIGELCAQFRRGVLAVILRAGTDKAIKTVEAYHKLHPAAAKSCWYPETFKNMESPDWQQLYVNAEHDGKAGVITIGLLALLRSMAQHEGQMDLPTADGLAHSDRD